MTNRITVARRALVDAMAAATSAPVAEVLPAKINTSTLVGFTPADEYIGPGDTFADVITVRVYGWLLVKPKNDRHDLEQLDDLLTALNAAARSSTWAIEAVDEPDVLKYGDWAMYGTRVTLTTTAHQE